jgi:hypothetical protein
MTKVKIYKMNRKKVNQIKSKKLFLWMNNSLYGKNRTHDNRRNVPSGIVNKVMI